MRFTDEKRYFVSESTVYRLLKAHDLITSRAFVVIKAADAFHTKTTRPNEMWQTDFTYFKIIAWGWMYRKRRRKAALTYGYLAFRGRGAHFLASAAKRVWIISTLGWAWASWSSPRASNASSWYSWDGSVSASSFSA